MHIIRLPRRLDGLNLEALNRSVAAGDARLDWRDVEPGIPAASLERLFTGMHLADVIDAIGGDTVPEALLPELQAALESAEARVVAENNDDIATPDEQVAPAVWLPENEREAITASEEAVEESIQEEVTPPVETNAPARPLLAAPAPALMRAEMEEMVLRDLLGPAGGENEEVDEARVHDRYLIGMLAPNKTQTVPEDLDELGDAEEGGIDEGAAEKDAMQKPSFNPASLGMSFSVDGDTTQLLVTARWGHYQRSESESIKTTTGRPRTVWRRTQRGGKAHTLQLQEGHIAPWRPEEDEQPDVFVRGLVRRAGDSWMVSLFLVNGQKEPKRLRDAAWLFQPELVVEAPNGAPIFRRRPLERQNRLTDEERAMAMLYRHHVSFAMGHGVSVHAETLPGDSTCAVRLSTHAVPSYDVPLTEAPTPNDLPTLVDLVLDMKILAESAPAELPTALQPPRWCLRRLDRGAGATPQRCFIRSRGVQRCRAQGARPLPPHAGTHTRWHRHAHE